MKDKYLFRGKTVPSANNTNPGNWVVGAYNSFTDIITDENGAEFPVFNSTVGQCTGLKDKNDNQWVFDGDIIQCDDGWTGVVQWSKKDLQWIVANVYETGHLDLCEFTTQDNKRLYLSNNVIGSIHDNDNPELLKGESQ